MIFTNLYIKGLILVSFLLFPNLGYSMDSDITNITTQDFNIEQTASDIAEEIKTSLEERKSDEEISGLISTSFKNVAKNLEEHPNKKILISQVLIAVANNVSEHASSRGYLSSMCSRAREMVGCGTYRHAKIAAVLLSAAYKISGEEFRDDMAVALGYITTKGGLSPNDIINFTENFTIPESLTEQQFSEAFAARLAQALAPDAQIHRHSIEIPFSRDYIIHLGDVLTSARLAAQIKGTEGTFEENETILSNLTKNHKYQVISSLKEKTGIKAISLTDPNTPEILYIALIKTHEGVLEYAKSWLSFGGASNAFHGIGNFIEDVGNMDIKKIGTRVINACSGLSNIKQTLDAGTLVRLDFITQILENLPEEINKIVLLGAGNAGGYVQSVMFHLQETSIPLHIRDLIEAHTFQAVGESYYECWGDQMLHLNITNHLWTPTGYFVKQGKGRHIGDTIYYNTNSNEIRKLEDFFIRLMPDNLENQVSPYAYNHTPAYFQGEKDSPTIPLSELVEVPVDNEILVDNQIDGDDEIPEDTVGDQ